MIREILMGTAVVVTLTVGSSGKAAEQDPPAPCTEPWYAYIESIVGTGDGAGHGPDVGSAEWQSVIEFKLRVHGDPAVPERSSAAWCDFVDGLASVTSK